MWRPAHGATSRPGPCRPESGYGRALGRPGPRLDREPVDDPAMDAHERSELGDLIAWSEGVEPVADAPAPVTP